MRKTFKTLHLWLSVPFGLVITIICLSGALLVFESEISELTNRKLYYVEQAESQKIPLATLSENVAATLRDSVKITSVTITSDDQRAYQFNLSKPRRASIYVDQYTGQIKGRSERSPFFTFVFKLHRWLLDSAKPDGGVFWGKMIVGVSTLMFVLVIICGAIVWIPRTAKSLKNRLKISTRKGSRRFWYDLHVAGGFYATALLLVIALTGLTWSFSWYRAGFYGVFGVETTKTAHNSVPQKKREGKSSTDSTQRISPYACWDNVYAAIAVQNPDAAKISIGQGKATVSFARWGNSRAADTYSFDARSGQITKSDPYATSSDATKLRGWIYSLHVGSWGGWFSKILTFLAALIGATLPVTGYYFWLKRITRPKKRSKIATGQWGDTDIDHVFN